MDTLRIIHHQGGDPLEVFSELEGSLWLHWKTCLREVAIGFNEIPQNFDSSGCVVYTGQQAYAFFLQVVCGLHSPLVGETEVMGQFKELIERLETISDLNARAQMAQFFKSVLTDAKMVRETCLKHLGSRTYGSLLRRYLKKTRGVSLLGAGKLAEDILPWLRNDLPVNVYCRQEWVAESLRERYDFAQIHLLESKTDLDEMLVIAASMTSAEVSSFIKNRAGHLKQIIDLRDVSSSDVVEIENVPTLTLSHFFEEIKRAEREVEGRVSEGFGLIQELTVKRFGKSEFRPFGWEDLCG